MTSVLHYRQPAHERRFTPCGPTGEHDPLGDGREVHQQGKGYTVGYYSATDAVLEIEDFPAVELGILESGELRLQGQGFDLLLQAGDCFVVPQGVAVRWQQRGPLRMLFMRFAGLDGDTTLRQPLRLDLHGPLQPCSPPATEVLVGATPQAWSQPWFEQGRLRIGVWACEPYVRRQVEPGYSELMHILEGTMVLSELTGGRHEVVAGDTLVVPAGATNAWTSHALVRKVYCILG